MLPDHPLPRLPALGPAPRLPELRFTPEELATCARVLEHLACDQTQLALVPKPLRKELLKHAGLISRPEREEKKRIARARRRLTLAEQRAHDEGVLAQTGMRHVRRAPSFFALPPPVASESAPATAPAEEELARPRSCYVCKREFRQVHFFYDQLCPPCAELNFAKRAQTADLRGRVALVTGARVKIGFQTCLLLLRAGASVVATTRFPRDAALRFSREADFATWQDRLILHGLDLRYAPSVELLCHSLDQRLSRLDFLINNAAQTVRRPPAFYAPLVPLEEAPLAEVPRALHGLLAADEELKRELPAWVDQSRGAVVAWNSGASAVGLTSPARLSQLPLTPDDTAHATGIFPTGAVDADLQQVDLRPMNSWRLPLAEVHTAELLEVHLVNAIAPFILNSKLKPLMMRSPERDKHIVNVSAMEAQFSRKKKTDKHPHTNMAKAALNMMTRTSAPDYAQDGIHMNSVDTGWVTDEDPLHHVTRKQREHGFLPPLDIIDGAARILDPIFSGLNTGVHRSGVFWKDYLPTEW